LIEQHEQLGGRLRDEFSADVLPRDVLQSEAETALALDTEKRLGMQVGSQLSLDELANDVDGAAVDPACRAGFAQASLDDVTREFDAVLLATGRGDTAWIKDSDVGTTTSGVRVDARTRMTSRDGVFAAGNAVRPYKLVVQSVAEGKLVAQCIDAWLRGVTLPDRRHKFETRLARMTAGELCDFCDGYPDTPGLDRCIPAEDLSDELARREAERCLNCDCEALDSCLLHHYASMYHCDAQRFRGSERRFEGRIVGDRVVLELGKCILCGICVQLAREAEDAVGLSFLGRSMETRIGPPPGVTLDQALGSAARRCAEACPTGAITLMK
jgi:ferredoxin